MEACPVPTLVLFQQYCQVICIFLSVQLKQQFAVQMCTLYVHLLDMTMNQIDNQWAICLSIRYCKRNIGTHSYSR